MLLCSMAGQAATAMGTGKPSSLRLPGSVPGHLPGPA
jgi:hypothetical protein